MKRSICLGLGTALFLLATAFAAAQSPPPAQMGPPAPGATNLTATPPVEDPAAAAQRKLLEDASQTRQGVEKLLRQLPREPATLAGQLQMVQRNQRRLEAVAWTALGLFALTVLLSSAGLVLALKQRRALLPLGRQEKDLDAREQEEARETPAEEETSSSGAATDLQPVREAGEAAAGGDPVAAAQDTGQLAAVSEGEKEALPALPPGMRHREIALLLARLCRETPRLAERFANSEMRQQFRGELDAPVHARLDRLISLSGQGDDLLRERWLGPDLVTTLDALARFYSEAVAEERNGHDTGLARELRGWLYDSFGAACRDEGWFAIDPIEPYKTKFNPQVHYAVAGRDVDGAEGQIIAIRAIGRRDVRTGAVKQPAEVVVGR